jgi:hypothetical protein
LQHAFEQRYPGLVSLQLVDMMTTDDDETRQAFHLIKSRFLAPPLVTINRRLCLYGDLDPDSLDQAVHQELKRRSLVP